MFGHAVRVQVKVVEEGWLIETKTYTLLDYEFKYRLYKACDLAYKILQKLQKKFTKKNDKTGMIRNPGKGCSM